MKKKSIADNADYVPQQLSFLDNSGKVRKDCVCRSVLPCWICEKPISRYSRTYYYLACGVPRRICKFCHKKYKQTFDIESLKHNCPNCIYCYEIEEKDKNTYKVFCEFCGHWLEWKKKYNCNQFIEKCGG